MKRELEKKIKYYTTLSKLPFYGKVAKRKIEDYKNRLYSVLLKEQQMEEVFNKLASIESIKATQSADINTIDNHYNENISKIISENLNLIDTKVNKKHRDYRKKKVLIIGSLQYINEISIYSNCILKALDYANIILHFYDYNSKKLIRIQSEAYEQNENYKEHLYTADLDKIDASLYDISIQIINPKDNFSAPQKPANISYAYIVPTENENLYDEIYNDININFDAILYPKIGLDQILYKHEFLIPKFYIPFCIDLNLYQRYNFQNENCKIGFLADIKTIEKTFKKLLPLDDFFKDNNIIVEFSYLISDPNFQRKFIDDEKKIIEELSEQCTKNITLCEGFLYLLPIEVFEKNRNCDLLIYIEDNENYMYNPIQSLRAGNCVIFPQHYKISSTFDIEGCWQFSDTTQLIDLIKEFVINHEKYFIPEIIQERKNQADKYANSKIKYLYRSLIQPELLETGDTNKILSNGICFKEKNLYTKYLYYLDKKIYDINKKLIPVPVLDVGFCSLLNKYVSMLTYADEDELYIPDWRVIRLIKNRYKFFKDKIFWSFCYGKAEDENVFLKIFEPPYNENEIPLELYQSDIMYEKAAKESFFTEYNIEREPNMAHKLTSLFLDKEYFPIFRQKYNKTFKKYIHLKPEIKNKIDKFYQKFMENKLTIGIHIRCDAHYDEWKNKVTAKDYDNHFSSYIKHIENILKENNGKYNNWCLYIATDNDIALEYFKNKYPSNICYSGEISRLTKEQEKEYENIKLKTGQYTIGYELQQRRCLKDSLRDVNLAYDILFDMYLLAKCQYFIYRSSNVPMAVSYINPDNIMIYAE